MGNQQHQSCAAFLGPDALPRLDAVVAAAILHKGFAEYSLVPPQVQRGSYICDKQFNKCVLVIGGSRKKRAWLRKHLVLFGCGLDYIPPVGSSGITATHILQLLHDRNVLRVVGFLDQSTGLVDELNMRLQLPGNDPRTSNIRRHKFHMHETLRAAGLRSCSHMETDDVDAAVAWAANRGTAVVVKPPESAGSEGISLCHSEASIRSAFQFLGEVNVEGAINTTMIVEELLVGPEYVVNTVSVEGEHLITDVWSSTPKPMSIGSCIYTEQRFVPAPPALVQYVLKVLDALGVRNGPAHLELVGGDDPCLIEINARAGGDLPRATESREGYDQIYKMAEGILRPDLFGLSSPYPVSPLCSTSETDWMHVCAVFLRSPFQGSVDKSVLRQLLQLPTFHSVGHILHYVDLDDDSRILKVKTTTDLFTCAGVLVFCSKDEGLIDVDVQHVRTAEAQGLYLGKCAQAMFMQPLPVMSETIQICDAAKSGDGTLGNVGIRMQGQFPCSGCRQKFDSEHTKQLHRKFTHDSSRHQED